MAAPRIDFYVLPDHQDQSRALLACRLADKAYGLGHTVYILTASEAQAAALDDLLWTFRQDSFIPHERYPLVGTEGSPVLIGSASPAEVVAQVLINFTLTLPDGFNWSISSLKYWQPRGNGSNSTGSGAMRRNRTGC